MTKQELDAAIMVAELEHEYAPESAKHRTAVVLEALQDARRRAEGCGICRKALHIGGKMWGEETADNGDIEDIDCEGGSYSFYYCPICGRALRGEKEERE